MKKILSLILSAAMLICAITALPVVTQAATMPSCSGQKASNITASSARVDFTIKNPSCLTIKTCGMQIRKKGVSSWTTKSETVTSSYQKKSSIPVWYTIGKGKEFSYTLSAGTTYEYRGFCKYNNKTYYTSLSTFKTSLAVTMPSCSGQKASNITTSSARVDFTIKNPSCFTIKTCGMQIRKKGVSSWTTKSETVTSSYQKKSSIPVWYTIGKGKEFSYTLSAGTTYEYRGFCKYNDKTYYTSVATFTTPKNETTSSLSSSKLNALKKKYPEGSSSTNCYTYAVNAFKYVYSKTPVQVKKNLNRETAWNNIKVGDVVHYYKSESDPDYKYGKQHWVLVTAKSDSKITVAEGNYSGKVHYGRTINKSKFTNGNYYNVEIRR